MLTVSLLKDGAVKDEIIAAMRTNGFPSTRTEQPVVGTRQGGRYDLSGYLSYKPLGN